MRRNWCINFNAYNSYAVIREHISLRLGAIDIDILSIAEKKGRAGIDKEELLFELGRLMKGIAYPDLVRRIEKLRDGNLITVEENGPDDFTVFTTEQGNAALRTE